MKVGRLLVLGVTLFVLLFPFSHPALSQDGSPPTPSPNAPVADNLIYLPFAVRQITPQQPGSSHPRTIDHRSVDLFSRIPEQYLTAARNTRVLFSDRSVGQNIHDSLNCLTATSWAASPAACRNDYTNANWNWRTFTQTDLNNGIVPLRIQFSPSPTRYNRNNWVFEFRGGSWSELTQDFIQSLGPTYISRGYNVLSYQFSYLNVRDIDSIANPNTGFFASSNNYDIHDLEAYWAQHPDKTFILWTSSLARAIGTQVSQDFNSGMRAYAQQHNMWLFDVAAIESYTDLGVPCYDNRDGVNYCSLGNDGRVIECENHPNDHLNIPAICQDYTTETEGGHLGNVSAANIRIAKAFWVLMARVAGWNP